MPPFVGQQSVFHGLQPFNPHRKDAPMHPARIAWHVRRSLGGYGLPNSVLQMERSQRSPHPKVVVIQGTGRVAPHSPLAFPKFIVGVKRIFTIRVHRLFHNGHFLGLGLTLTSACDAARAADNRPKPPSEYERRLFHAAAVEVQWHISREISQTIRPLNRLYR
jgi:hypothetical protein